MTAHLTLDAVTATLVRAGVQTVVSVDEEPTMECPDGEGLPGKLPTSLRRHRAFTPRDWRCGTCDGSGRVPLSGDVEIRAGGDIGEAPDGWWTYEHPLLGPILTNDNGDRSQLPEFFRLRIDAPVARATVQCVPVVDRSPVDADTPRPSLALWEGLGKYGPLAYCPSGDRWYDLSDQFPFLDIDAPWALILSDVRPVEDR